MMFTKHVRPSKKLHRSRNRFNSSGCFEALEPRQLMAGDLAGNTPLLAYDPGALTSTATVLNDAVSNTDSKDFYKISLSGTKLFSATLAGLSANANLRLYSSTGTVLATSTNAGITNDSIQMELAAGNYYLLVYNEVGSTNYALSLAADNVVVDGAGNTRNQAADVGTINVGDSITKNDYIGGTDANDYYKMTIASISTFTATLSGLAAGSDADIQLLNSAGGVIASSSNTSNTNETIATTLEAGTYYVRVYRFAGGSTYTLKFDDVAVTDGAGNSLAAAKDIVKLTSTPVVFNDSVSYYDNDDYYTFVLTANSDVNFELSGLSSDANLYVYDQKGAMAYSSTNSGVTKDRIMTTFYQGVYYVRVNATTGKTNYTLTMSATPKVTAPTASTADGTNSVVTTGSYNELQINGTAGNDVILISQTASAINISINGHTSSQNLVTGGESLDEIALWAGAGDDTVIVDTSVALNVRLYGEAGNDLLINRATGRTTIVSIGGGTDTLIGNNSNTNFWLDSVDTYKGSSSDDLVHTVASFYQPYTTNQFETGYVPLELKGQDLEDSDYSYIESETGYTYTTANFSSVPLFSDGPSVLDTTQGGLGDCYLLAGIGSLAYANQDNIRNIMVDLGDGTYAVQFTRDGKRDFVRVDADLVVYSDDTSMLAFNSRQNTGTYDSPVRDGPLWACIIEKAYTYYRTGENTYASIEGGFGGAAQGDFGYSYEHNDARGDKAGLYAIITAALAAHQAVTLGTVPEADMPADSLLIGGHAYVVLSAAIDGNGVITYTVRNPWGIDNYPVTTDAMKDGIVTVTASQVQTWCNYASWTTA